MALDRSNFNLFGLDLYRLYEHGRLGFAALARWPLLQRLLPAEPASVRKPDGSRARLLPDGRVVPQGYPLANDLPAVLLPDDCVLAASLRLPASATADEQAQAVSLAVQADSPFADDDTIWGHRSEVDAAAGGALIVHYAIVARSHIESCLADHGAGAAADPEVWAWAGAAPIILPGYGGGRRQHIRRQRLLHSAALAVLVLVLLIALVATPVQHRRQQALDAQHDYDALAAQTAPVAAARAALGDSNAHLEVLRQHIAAHPDPGWLLVRLTALLPDSVYLLQLDTRGKEVTLRGTADNAGALIELLGAEPGISEVRSASAIVRNQVSGRETFIIQFHFQVPPQAPAADPEAPPGQAS